MVEIGKGTSRPARVTDLSRLGGDKGCLTHSLPRTVLTVDLATNMTDAVTARRLP